LGKFNISPLDPVSAPPYIFALDGEEKDGYKYEDELIAEHVVFLCCRKGWLRIVAEARFMTFRKRGLGRIITREL